MPLRRSPFCSTLSAMMPLDLGSRADWLAWWRREGNGRGCLRFPCQGCCPPVTRSGCECGCRSGVYAHVSACADAACEVYVNGVCGGCGTVCGLATLIGACAYTSQARTLLAFPYSFRDPRSSTPSLVSGGWRGSDIWGRVLLAHTPELGLHCQYLCCLLVPGLCCESLQGCGESLGWLAGCARCTLPFGFLMGLGGHLCTICS